MKKREKPNILIIDDTPANLHAMKKLLEPLEVNVITADSGNMALTLLLEFKFMLILMDVNMPVMDGYETAELIMQVEESKHIPIIFVTACDKGEKHKGYKVGAVDYLYKPIEPDILISKVKVFLKLHEQTTELFEQKKHLEGLLGKQNLLLQQKKHMSGVLEKRDVLLDIIQKQTKKCKIQFTFCVVAFVVIVTSISIMYSLISKKNIQLINYAELLNEKNVLFDDLKKALLESINPNIKLLLKTLNENEVRTLTNRWITAPQNWSWKQANDIAPNENVARYKIVSAVARLTNIVASHAKFNIPMQPQDKLQDSPGWIMYGSYNKNSDVDYVITPINNNQHLFHDNAIQGRKAIVANLLFRTLFGSTSSKLLDAEFYPPHLGTFLHEPISSKASFSAIFSQMAHFFSADDMKSFEKIFIEQCKKLDVHNFDNILKMLGESTDLYRDIKTIKKIVPNPELANNIINNKITLAMTKFGDEIDKLQPNDPNRIHLLETFVLLDILRTHFLPEGYISIGAFRVVCENAGGQKHQLAHGRIEEAFLKKDNGSTSEFSAMMNVKAETAKREQNTIEELVESVGENCAFFHNKSNIVDASKYGNRIYDSTLEVMQHLIKRTQDNYLIEEIQQLEREVAKTALEMSILESTKRGKLLEKAFLHFVSKFEKEDLSQCSDNGFSEENLHKTIKIANIFYKEAKFGNKDFIIMDPERRIEVFKHDLGKKELSPKIYAMLESVARINNPKYEHILEQIFIEEFKSQIEIMKERRGIILGTDEELFNLLKLEARQTTAKLLCYSLKVGILLPPQTKDTELFDKTKTEIRQTIAKLLSNTLNLGLWDT